MADLIWLHFSNGFSWTFVLLLQLIEPMKLPAFILSLYILIFTVIPCVDVMQDNAPGRTEVSHQKQDNNHKSDADHCSPFCTCNCCSTSVIVQEYQLRLSYFPFTQKQYINTSCDQSSDTHAPIWQPPKIA
ncbi:MAG: DUF6660 family protein [Bacteroidota bacterium]